MTKTKEEDDLAFDGIQGLLSTSVVATTIIYFAHLQVLTGCSYSEYQDFLSRQAYNGLYPSIERFYGVIFAGLLVSICAIMLSITGLLVEMVFRLTKMRYTTKHRQASILVAGFLYILITLSLCLISYEVMVVVAVKIPIGHRTSLLVPDLDTLRQQTWWEPFLNVTAIDNLAYLEPYWGITLALILGMFLGASCIVGPTQIFVIGLADEVKTDVVSA